MNMEDPRRHQAMRIRFEERHASSRIFIWSSVRIGSRLLEQLSPVLLKLFAETRSPKQSSQRKAALTTSKK